MRRRPRREVALPGTLDIGPVSVCIGRPHMGALSYVPVTMTASDGATRHRLLEPGTSMHCGEVVLALHRLVDDMAVVSSPQLRNDGARRWRSPVGSRARTSTAT